ncbi:MAG: uracil-DNA glycosylase family protein [Chitinophagaceae bacterium]
MNFADKMLQFLQTLHLPVTLPKGIEVMNPFLDTTTLEICRQFYQKYYQDEHLRWMILGINPGRFGGGITGIPFTDPIRLQNDCGINNPWSKKQELSSVFIYDMIRAFGGPEFFYKNFYITAISPLGFTGNNKNLNYYDDKTLQSSIEGFVVDNLKRQLNFGIHRDVGFCLGEGINYRYLKRLNDSQHFFDTIVPLPHPRFIMQYRLKRKQEYIEMYYKQLGKCADG